MMKAKRETVVREHDSLLKERMTRESQITVVRKMMTKDEGVRITRRKGVTFVTSLTYERDECLGIGLCH
jgi:hypothetical protein